MRVTATLRTRSGKPVRELPVIKELPAGTRARQGVGARYRVTSCDLGIFVQQAAEPVSPDDLDIGIDSGPAGYA
jgi:hypothetical protein